MKTDIHRPDRSWLSLIEAILSSNNTRIFISYACFILFYAILMISPSKSVMGLTKILWNSLLIFPLITGLYISLSTLIRAEDLGPGQKAMATIAVLIMFVSINFSLLLLFF